MEYSIRQLAALAGVSTRTLRYYDEIHLLKPERVNEAGYRYYGEKEVALLQQILFYRERDLGLEVISKILAQPNFDIERALYEHLKALQRQQAHISSLIQTVELTIADLKGEGYMSDDMKFQVFKEKLVKEQEKTYGEEARNKYGDEEVDASQQKILGLSKADYERFQELEEEVFRQLKAAVKAGVSPESEEGKRIVMLHKNWLGYTWKEYSAQAHKGLAAIYTADSRFQEYYDREQKGCAEFLIKAVEFWAGK